MAQTDRPRGDAATAPPPPAPPETPTLSPSTGPPSEDRTYATFVHISSLSAYLGMPFGWFLGPLILWLIKKDESQFIDRHGRSAMNFNLTLTLAVVLLYAFAFLAFFIAFLATGASMATMGPFGFFPFAGLPFVGFLLVGLAGLALMGVHIAFTAIAATRANKGEPYEYPFGIRFFK